MYIIEIYNNIPKEKHFKFTTIDRDIISEFITITDVKEVFKFVELCVEYKYDIEVYKSESVFRN